MTQYEIVFFSLQPGCRLEAVKELLCQLLGQKKEALCQALRSSGTVLIGGLSEAEAKSLQIRLVASGLLCNYRPTSPPCELRLKPKSFTMPCPHCGRPNQIIENERRRRCRHCRRFWSLWAMREEAHYPRSPDTSPALSPRRRSWPRWAALALLTGYFVFVALPFVRAWTENLWRSAHPSQASDFAYADSEKTSVPSRLALDPFELAWILDSGVVANDQTPPALKVLDQTPGSSTCSELARLCQILKPMGTGCHKETNQAAITR